jgi:hypothetical protein
MSTLETTTVQEVRGFLSSLGLDPSPYADSQEVIDHLVETVRRRREDPALRRQLQVLVEKFTGSAEIVGRSDGDANWDRLSAEELARALTWLLEDRPAVPPSGQPHVWAHLLAIAILLIALVLAGSCGKSNNRHSSDATCAENLSADHFGDLLNQTGDLTPNQIVDAVDQYENMAAQEQKSVMNDLCAMSPEDIAAYIESKFGDDWNSDDDTTPNGDDDGVVDDDTMEDDDIFADDDAYKGVSLGRNGR